MSNPHIVPGTIKSLPFLLPFMALAQLALAALLIFNGAISVAMAGTNPMGYIGMTIGVVLVVCALVTIVAIFTLRRRSRTMRIAETASCLITIGIATLVLIEYLSMSYAGDEGGYIMLSVLVSLSLPLLLTFGLPLTVLILLWAAPATRAFFMASPPRV